ncbi:hypothetical protein HWV23_13450 [Natronomonas halophila]|uniref:DUF7319 domain-containing protein n=1 Tax=Natronomonas halophila TaxID=2747817 RepID=UPI0015B40E21|nr:hypothetical protein [Natronomonas halophila]QLD86691.1 hypothetical protein HWV23_13450 [Natronomonas halophila]
MADSRQSSEDESDGSADTDAGADAPGETEELSTEELRQQVEEQYDFEKFSPADMAEMSVEEWEAVFDPDSWITGSELLDRVEAELRHNVQTRQVFAAVERVGDGEDERVVAYSDEGYVIVRPDGSIQGTGTILRDVEPMVALCSMEDYDVPDVDEDAGLPHPESVPEASGDFGNQMLQVVAGVLSLSGLAFIGSWLASLVGALDLGFAGAIVLTLGIVFLLMGIVLFVTVANARLSDRMRSQQYRDRLRAVGAGSEGRPSFLPDEAFEAGGRQLEVEMERVHREALAVEDESEQSREETGE